MFSLSRVSIVSPARILSNCSSLIVVTLDVLELLNQLTSWVPRKTKVKISEVFPSSNRTALPTR